MDSTNPPEAVPLTSTTLFIPITVTIASTVGLSLAMFIGIIIIIARHRIIARREQHVNSGNLEKGQVPQLIITDTSIFPVSSVVVGDDTSLDKVIASFKPLGIDHIPQTVSIVENLTEVLPPKPKGKEDEESLFPLPQASSPLPGHPQSPKMVHASNCDNIEVDPVPRHPKDIETSSTSGSSDTTSDSDNSHKNGIWWEDFHVELSETSLESLDLADMDAESVYSYYSYRDNFGVSRSISTINKSVKGLAHRSKMGTISSEMNKVMSSEREILEYCWRISDCEIINMPAKESIRNDLQHVQEACIEDKGQSSIRHSLVLPSVSEEDEKEGRFDPNILEYCWRISKDGSFRSGNTLSEGDAIPIQVTKAMKSVSSVSRLDHENTSDTGHLVVPWEEQPIVTPLIIESAHG